MSNKVHSIIRDEIIKGGLKKMWLIERIRKILRNRKRDREIMVFLERRREQLEKQGESSEDKEIRIFKNRSEGQTRRRTREFLQHLREVRKDEEK